MDALEVVTSAIFSTCFLFLSSNFPFETDVSKETTGSGVFFSDVLGSYLASQSRSENSATLR